MSTIDFFVPGIATPKGSLRAFIPKGWNRPVLTSTSGEKLKHWNTAIAVEAHNHRPSGIDMEAPVSVTFCFYLARPKSAKKREYVTVKPDVDKLCRAALDPMIGILFNDDSQVVKLEATKTYSNEANSPGARIIVEWL